MKNEGRRINQGSVAQVPSPVVFVSGSTDQVRKPTPNYVLCLAALCTLLTTPAAADLPTSEVRMHNHAPTLFINGTPHTGMSYMTYAPNEANFAKFGAAGVHLYSFSATPTESTYNLAPLCWIATDEFDYSNLDARAHMVLDNDPDAFFFPRLFLGTPEWWADAHPDELVQVDRGDGVPQVFRCRGEKRVASWASERWRADTAEAIRRLIAHIEASGYGSRVIGYHIASGTTEEWMQWGSNEDEWADYSPANTARFRVWLRERYRTDDALRAAWNDPEITLDTAAIPARAARAASEFGLMRDPATAQASIDYVLYTSWLAADTIQYFAHTTKEALNRERLVGVFYGYVLQLAGAQREQNAGHLAIADILDCPDIDFITSPSSYAFRELGTGFPHAMSLVDSIKRHGKLWFDENDYRTWLTPNVSVGQYGKTANFEESLLAQQREFAWVLTNRLGMWWFDMGGGWYDDPRMLDSIGRMTRIAESCLDANGESVAEIAFVVDDKSSAYVSPGNPYGWPALVQQLPGLGRVGAPFDAIHLGDLAASRAYKLYIFPNCFAPSDEERAAIAEIQQRADATIVWIGLPGIYSDGALDPDAMTALTSVPLHVTPVSSKHTIIPTDAATVWGWNDAASFTADRDFRMLALPEAGWGVTLGTLAERGAPALVASADGRTVFSAVPRLPAELLRTVAKHAGVHRYVDTNDIVWACHDLLAISVAPGGERRVRLPKPRTAVDLWSDRTLATDVIEFMVNIPDNGTALVRLK